MKKYADDYETVFTTDENGHEKITTLYRGDYFEINLDKEDSIHYRRSSFVLLATIIILHISGGFVGNQGMYQFNIALPYVIAFFPLLYLAAGVLRLPKEKRKYRRNEIRFSFDRVKTSSIILFIFLGIGVLGEIVFIFFGSAGDQNMLEFLYLVLEALTTAAVIFFIKMQRQIHILTAAKNNHLEISAPS